MAIINVDDAYILNETGAQVDKVTGLFTKDEDTTSGEKAFAQLNIGTAGSNRNLLDNPWFTVNQRGASGTISTANQFGADRWKKSGGSGSVIVGDGYFTPVGGGGYRQLNPWNKIISGRTYTVSAMTADGNVYSATGVLSSTTSGWQIASHLIPNSLWVGAQNNGGNLDILFTGQNGDIQVIAVKLELGSVSTLANDAPPAYEQALNECQYRCVVYESMPANFLFCRGVATTSTNLRAVIDLPRSMAKDKVPTVTMTGSLTTPQGNTITAMASASTVSRGNKLVVNFTTTGLTGGNTYDISTGSGGQTITISADL